MSNAWRYDGPASASGRASGRAVNWDDEAGGTGADHAGSARAWIIRLARSISLPMELLISIERSKDQGESMVYDHF